MQRKPFIEVKKGQLLLDSAPHVTELTANMSENADDINKVLHRIDPQKEVDQLQNAYQAETKRRTLYMIIGGAAMIVLGVAIFGVAFAATAGSFGTLGFLGIPTGAVGVLIFVGGWCALSTIGGTGIIAFFWGNSDRMTRNEESTRIAKIVNDDFKDNSPNPMTFKERENLVRKLGDLQNPYQQNHLLLEKTIETSILLSSVFGLCQSRNTDC